MDKYPGPSSAINNVVINGVTYDVEAIIRTSIELAVWRIMHLRVVNDGNVKRVILDCVGDVRLMEKATRETVR